LGKRDGFNCCACRLFISIVFFFFVIKLYLLTIQFFFKLY
jgi:hypothetical protein